MDLKATDGGIVDENVVTADRADIRLHSSEEATITGNRFTAAARRLWRNR
ncbi:hypothetical protein ACFXKW_04935 [Streptomyces sp. NPDC059193]